MKIYLDMDGVLSDLDGALALFGGVDLSTVQKDAILRNRLIRERVSKLGLEHWESLEPLNKEQWEKDLRSISWGEVEILTSFGTWNPLEIGPLSHQGKCNWLKTHYGNFFDEGIISGFNGVEKCEHKELFSGLNTCLIDDAQENCSRFSRRLGVAFLYTQENHSEVISKINGMK